MLNENQRCEVMKDCGPCVLRPSVQPAKYGLKLKVIFKSSYIYIEYIEWCHKRLVLKWREFLNRAALYCRDYGIMPYCMWKKSLGFQVNATILMEIIFTIAFKDTYWKPSVDAGTLLMSFLAFKPSLKWLVRLSIFLLKSRVCLHWLSYVFWFTCHDCQDSNMFCSYALKNRRYFPPPVMTTIPKWKQKLLLVVIVQ